MFKSVPLSLIAIAFMASLLIVEAKSLGELNDRIVGEQIAKRGQFPYQVSVRKRLIDDLFEHFCGGVIISEQYVLTTPSCTQANTLSSANMIVVVGVNDLISGGMTYAVSNITNHPQYNQTTMENDISVIETAEKILFKLLVQPARLPTSNVAADTVAFVSGWGKTTVRRYFF